MDILRIRIDQQLESSKNLFGIYIFRPNTNIQLTEHLIIS